MRHHFYLRVKVSFTASTLLSPHQHYFHRVNITFTASTFLSPRQHYFNHVNITFTRQHLCHCLNISKASTYISPRQHFVHRVNISIPASKLFHRVNICFTTSHFFHPYLSSRNFFHRVIWCKLLLTFEFAMPSAMCGSAVARVEAYCTWAPIHVNVSFTCGVQLQYLGDMEETITLKWFRKDVLLGRGTVF